MTSAELFDLVEKHGWLEGLGILDTDLGPMLFIRHMPTALITQIPANALGKLDWPTLEAVLIGRREPRVLEHMTRIVGYYSRLFQWNTSKIGELRDRIRGTYGLEGGRSSEAKAKAEQVVESL